MTAVELLNEITRSGVRLRRDGDRLRYAGKPDALNRLLPEMRTHKAELLALLSPDSCGGADPETAQHLPEHIEEIVGRMCVWRLVQLHGPARFIVTGPDFDLRLLHADAVPLFDAAARNRVRRHGRPPDNFHQNRDDLPF